MTMSNIMATLLFLKSVCDYKNGTEILFSKSKYTYTVYVNLRCTAQGKFLLIPVHLTSWKEAVSYFRTRMKSLSFVRPSVFISPLSYFLLSQWSQNSWATLQKELNASQPVLTFSRGAESHGMIKKIGSLEAVGKGCMGASGSQQSPAQFGSSMRLL